MLIFVLIAWMQAPTCVDAADCRQQSIAASVRGDFELAHDLAWRAVQKGRPNDPELMLVLARAQSLSGRPGDALVMLSRIVELGGRPDVANDPDFRRVRALPGWTELEARLASPPTTAPPPPLPARNTPAVPAAKERSPRASGAAAALAPAPSPASAPVPSALPAPPAAPAPPVEETAFDAPGVAPFAIARDAVSRRFVLGDRAAHRLLIVDEVSHNVVNYVRASSAGFYEELTAFTIDPRRGDLWVASANGEGEGSASLVHKLQLVSGRTLAELRASEKAGAVRFVSVAVAPDGTVFALDAIGPRLFRARAGATTLDEVLRIAADQPATLTAADNTTLYAGTADGIVRLDTATKSSRRVSVPQPLGALVALTWRAGSLVGVERTADGSAVVRLSLNTAGTRVQSRKVLAPAAAAAVGALAGDTYYYLSDTGTIRRVPVR